MELSVPVQHCLLPKTFSYLLSECHFNTSLSCIFQFGHQFWWRLISKSRSLNLVRSSKPCLLSAPYRWPNWDNELDSIPRYRCQPHLALEALKTCPAWEFVLATRAGHGGAPGWKPALSHQLTWQLVLHHHAPSYASGLLKTDLSRRNSPCFQAWSWSPQGMLRRTQPCPRCCPKGYRQLWTTARASQNKNWTTVTTKHCRSHQSKEE